MRKDKELKTVSKRELDTFERLFKKLFDGSSQVTLNVNMDDSVDQAEDVEIEIYDDEEHVVSVWCKVEETVFGEKDFVMATPEQLASAIKTSIFLSPDTLVTTQQFESAMERILKKTNIATPLGPAPLIAAHKCSCSQKKEENGIPVVDLESLNYMSQNDDFPHFGDIVKVETTAGRGEMEVDHIDGGRIMEIHRYVIGGKTIFIGYDDQLEPVKMIQAEEVELHFAEREDDAKGEWTIEDFQKIGEGVRDLVQQANKAFKAMKAGHKGETVDWEGDD